MGVLPVSRGVSSPRRAALTGAAQLASATRRASLHGNSCAGEGGAPSLLLLLLPGLPQHGALPAIRRSFPLAPTFYQSGEELRSPAMVSWRYFRVSIGTESGREGKNEGERAGSPCPGREWGWESPDRVLSQMMARHKSVRADTARKRSCSPAAASPSFPQTDPISNLPHPFRL